MSKKVLLISVAEIINSTVIEDNVDYKLLSKAVIIAQENSLRQVIGRDLYESVIDTVYNQVQSGTSVSAIYASLIEVIKPYLIAKTVCEFIILNSFKISNKGVQKLNDNSSTTLGTSDIESIKDYYDNLVAVHKIDLIKFLQDNQLDTSCSNVDFTSDASGWFLGDSIPCSTSGSGSIPVPATDRYTVSGSFSGGTLSLIENDASVISITGFTNDSTYTNSTLTPSALGGISAGSSFNEKTIQEMLDLLLYPYQSPAFTSFGLQGISSPLEAGNAIGVDQTFIWSTSNSSNVVSVNLSGYNFLAMSDLDNDGSEPVTFTAPSLPVGGGIGTRGWQISGVNTRGDIFYSSLTIRWDFKMYVGTNNRTTLNEARLEALSVFSSVKNGFAGTYSMPGGDYKYFAYADVYGTPTSFTDTSNNLNIAMFDGYANTDSNGVTYDLVSVTNAYGVAINYRVYRSLNILNDAINIRII